MSQKLFALNDDLRRLRENGFFVQIIDEKFLVMRHVPYVNSSRQVEWGTLVSPLDLAGDRTRNPVGDHQVQFDGDFPFDPQGVRLNIGGEGQRHEIAPGLFVSHNFSRKPEGGYQNYYDKMTTYHAILSGPARTVDPDIRTRQFPSPIDDDPESIFEYADTASGRSGTAALAAQFKSEVVAIIGLGGTGAYILDKVAKTPVKEIRLSPAQWQLTFDGETVSLRPSIGNWNLPCRSHYVISNSRVIEAPSWNEEEVAYGQARDKHAINKLYWAKSGATRRTASEKVSKLNERKDWLSKIGDFLAGRR